MIGIEGTALVLETPGGPVNVLARGDTIFRIPGVEEPALGDVEIGNHVTVAGTWEDEATFDAVAVVVRVDRRAGARGVVRGRAIDIGAESLVLGTPRGPMTVRVGDETRYHAPGVDDAGLGDIELGDRIVAMGSWSEDGTLQAVRLTVLGGA